MDGGDAAAPIDGDAEEIKSIVNIKMKRLRELADKAAKVGYASGRGAPSPPPSSPLARRATHTYISRGRKYH
jgi:hypothetical protein